MYFENLWKQIGTHGIMILSTCSDNRVTSRAMSVVVINGKFYCQTNGKYLKCRQIESNPKVSLCMNNISVEGNCKFIGRPHDNSFFMDAMNCHFPTDVARSSNHPDECVLEITPRLISSWIYENDKPFMEYWNFETHSYTKQEH